MTDITIPEEALKAGRKAFANAGTAEDDRDPFAEACLAMLRAWETDKHRMIVGTALDEVGGTYPAIILPLTENANDKA